jgi:rhodanese-related sulfurtransferase
MVALDSWAAVRNLTWTAVMNRVRSSDRVTGATKMSAQLGRENVHDLEPEEVARGLADGKVLLVDVREPSETQVERYPEAFYLPMSEFDPAAIPDPQGRQVVFACRSGNRSVTASLMAQAAGLPYDAHLAGGMKAWKALGLPTEI